MRSVTDRQISSFHLPVMEHNAARPYLHKDSADSDWGGQERSCHGGSQRPELNGVLEEGP